MSGAPPFPPGTSGNPPGRRRDIKETAPRGAKPLLMRLLREYRRAGIDPVRDAFTEALRDPRQRPAALGLVVLCAPHVLAGPLARHFRAERLATLSSIRGVALALTTGRQEFPYREKRGSGRTPRSAPAHAAATAARYFAGSGHSVTASESTAHVTNGRHAKPARRA